MIKFNSLVLVLIFLFSFISGCKYEDGPAISLRSACKRVEGTYDVVKFEVGGADSTYALKSQTCYGRITFEYKDKSGEFYGNRDLYACKFHGNWGLFENNTKIVLQFFGNFPTVEPLGNYWDLKWDITKLKNDEMIFTTNYNGKFCKLQLKE